MRQLLGEARHEHLVGDDKQGPDSAKDQEGNARVRKVVGDAAYAHGALAGD